MAEVGESSLRKLKALTRRQCDRSFLRRVMPSKIIMVTNAVAPDKLGGLERYVRELAAALVRANLDVSVVAKSVIRDEADAEIGDDGVRILRHTVPHKADPLFAAKYPYYVRKGVALALQSKPQAIIHGHFPVPMMANLQFPGRVRRPYLYTFHAPVHRELLAERQGTYTLPRPIQKSAVKCFRIMEAAVVSRASKVTVLSEFMRQRLADLSPRAAAEAALIPGGVDTKWFSPGATAQRRGNDDAPLLFTARRLTPRTGVRTLIDAMPAVLAVFPHARLAIAGDGHMRTEIERQILSLGLQKAVVLLGRVTNEDLVNWYRNASITVMPTAELEGFGLTTAESLSCGTPVLVTPVGANPELVGDLDLRLVADGADAAALSEGILRLLKSPQVLDDARARLRDGGRRAWSWDVVAQRYLDLYEQHARTRR